MKLNLFYTLILTFFATSISGQMCENEGSTITFYTESINSGTITINLNDEFGLDDLGRICTPGIATSDDPETYSNSIEMTQLSDNELWQAMAHFHLYKCRKAAIEELFAGIFPFASEEIVTFGVDEIGDAELMFSEETLDLQLRKGPDLNGGANYNPFGEDAFAIANSYFQVVHYKLAGKTIPQSEGVSLGLASYFAYRYMRMNDYKPEDDTKIFRHGGIGSDKWAELDIELDNIVIGGVYGTDDFSFGKKQQKKSEFLSAVLWKLSQTLSDDYDMGGNIILSKVTKVDRMVANALDKITDADIGEEDYKQAATAQILYYQAIANDLSPKDLCIINYYFTLVYGDKYSEGLIEPESQTKDFMIRDSYNGQYSSYQEETQDEDIGNEPNNETSDFSHSPDIWNRLNSEDIIVKEHENPEYNETTENPNGAPNYLYVDVRAKDCAVPVSSEKLHVYIRESHLSSTWPKDWTEGYYVEDDDTTPLIGYEITHSDNNDLLGPDFDGIPMSDYVSIRYELDIDQVTGEQDVWRVFRYKIPWVPFNPLELPDYTEIGAKAHVCLLARVVAASDPMANEQLDVSAWKNNKANNNIAIKNTSIIHVNGDPNVNSNEIIGLNIKSPYDPTGGTGNTGGTGGTGGTTGTTVGTTGTELDIEIAIRPNDDYTDDGDPIIPSTTGPGDPVIFNYIDLEIILSDDFLAEWTSSGLQGSGFTWVNANTIKVTSPNFSIKNIKLPPRRNHRIFVKTTSKQDFTIIDFDLVLIDNNNNVVGVQPYYTKGSLWIDRSTSKRSDRSNIESRSTIDVHPNPAQNFITVTSNENEINRIEVYSVNNEKLNVSFNKVDTHTRRVEISSLSSGIYFMKVQRADIIETIKFIKTQ